MALSGASVLHPDAVVPCQQRNIPICIRNTFTFGTDFDPVTVVNQYDIERETSTTTSTCSRSSVLAISSKGGCITFVCKKSVDEAMQLQLQEEMNSHLTHSGVHCLSWHCNDGLIAVEIEETKCRHAVSICIDYVFGGNTNDS